MPYIGNSPLTGNYNKLDSLSGFNGSTTAFNLTVNSNAITPVRAETLLVSLNGVIQQAVTDYTVSGSQITFTTAPTSGDSVFIIAFGEKLDIGTPTDATVTSAKLASTFFTGATDIGANIADADLFLMDDGAGGTIRKTAASRIKTYAGVSLAGIDDQSSSNDDQLTITDTDVIINEDSDDVNFRVESNGQANMLFVDGGEDRIGVGIGVPLARLHIQGSDGAVSSWSTGVNTDDLIIENNSHAGLTFVTQNDYASQIIYVDSDSHAGGAGIIYFNSDQNFIGFYTDESTDGATIHFKIANDGTLTGTDTSIGSISDERLKENITDYTYDLETFKKFKPKTFDWKNPGQHGNKSNVRGFVAQDLLLVDPYWCSTTDVDEEINKPESVNPDIALVNEALNIGGVAVDAGNQYTSHLGKKDSMYVSVINQLIAKIETLETKVEALES